MTIKAGFTLIELSIVLVIIGLIVGGVLVGQNLIAAAEARAQITQIEKYNTAVNTFKGKFGYLPGDMTPSAATQFGFTVGTGCNGTIAFRDGNGLIDGYNPASGNLSEANAEAGFFWIDISTANMIDGTFPSNGAAMLQCGGGGSVPALTLTAGANFIGDYFPAAKMGRQNFVFVYEINGANWLGLSAITHIDTNGYVTSSANIPVIQAYNIDKKMDDGLPQSSNVQTTYLNGSETATVLAPNAASDSATTCYNSTTPAYSIAYNGGAGANCALSFRFQ